MSGVAERKRIFPASFGDGKGRDLPAKKRTTHAFARRFGEVGGIGGDSDDDDVACLDDKDAFIADANGNPRCMSRRTLSPKKRPSSAFHQIMTDGPRELQTSVLQFLELHEVLRVSAVCRSYARVVREDLLLWRAMRDEWTQQRSRGPSRSASEVAEQNADLQRNPLPISLPCDSPHTLMDCRCSTLAFRSECKELAAARCYECHAPTKTHLRGEIKVALCAACGAKYCNPHLRDPAQLRARKATFCSNLGMSASATNALRTLRVSSGIFPNAHNGSVSCSIRLFFLKDVELKFRAPPDNGSTNNARRRRRP